MFEYIGYNPVYSLGTIFCIFYKYLNTWPNMFFNAQYSALKQCYIDYWEHWTIYLAPLTFNCSLKVFFT